MKEESIKIDWKFEADSPEPVDNPVMPQYNSSQLDEKISIFDFLPTSDLCPGLEFEELTCSSALNSERHGFEDVKVEGTEEPCAAALAIEANIPTPAPTALSKWRTFISAAYYHPNILAHKDVADLKELFQLLGSDISFESINVMIDLGQTVKEYKPTPYLRPRLPSAQKPAIFNFAHVKDFFIDMELKVCIVTKYGITDSMKKAVTEMTTFIVEYPEALYLEVYGFILDFLLKFGVQSEIVIDAVMRTQARRRKRQRPASVLILKKANKLGKGRKEFLQKKLLESPEQFSPIVPIISEPTPIRHLRNRRTGGGDTAADRTPESCVQNSQNSSNLYSTQSLAVPEIKNCSTPLVFAVKRKLFVEDSPEEIKFEQKNFPDPSSISSKTECQQHVASNGLGHRKKRFYSRRDSSTIEKPFICSICPDRSFAYKGNLVLHMKKKHSTSARGNPKRQENQVPAFSCPVCLRGYATKYRCRTHMERHHPHHVDWDPISNFESTRNLKKTATIGKKKHGGCRLQKGSVVGRHIIRQLPTPLSDTQNSSPEKEKSSQPGLNSKLDYYCNNFSSRRQLNDRQYSTFSHVRTRQQFRTAVK